MEKIAAPDKFSFQDYLTIILKFLFIVIVITILTAVIIYLYNSAKKRLTTVKPRVVPQVVKKPAGSAKPGVDEHSVEQLEIELENTRKELGASESQIESTRLKLEAKKNELETRLEQAKALVHSYDPAPKEVDEANIYSIQERLGEILLEKNRLDESSKTLLDEQTKLEKKLRLLQLDMVRNTPKKGTPCTPETSLEKCGTQLYCRKEAGLFSSGKYECKEKREFDLGKRCDEPIGYFCKPGAICKDKICAKK
jgi:chromosome segregation ATPase